MNKNQIEARLQKLEEQRSQNPVRIIDMSDLELEAIVGGHLTDAQLEEMACGASVVIVDDIQEEDL
jgi:hypothetical protein